MKKKNSLVSLYIDHISWSIACLCKIKNNMNATIVKVNTEPEVDVTVCYGYFQIDVCCFLLDDNFLLYLVQGWKSYQQVNTSFKNEKQDHLESNKNSTYDIYSSLSLLNQFLNL